MQHDLLAKVVAALDSAGIAHMVTCSFASTYHGEPRMTRDIDLVIDPDTTTVSLFIEQFEPGDFYIDNAVSATARRDIHRKCRRLDSVQTGMVEVFRRRSAVPRCCRHDSDSTGDTRL